MIRRLSLALVAGSLGAPLLWSGVQPNEAWAQTSCFVCDDWPDETWGYMHVDAPLFNNDKQGFRHSTASPYDCDTHVEYLQGGGPPE
jgi:hypothetical protein